MTARRPSLRGVRRAIQTLDGMTSGFDAITAAQCAPGSQEAEEWAADLARAVSRINRFRRSLKAYRTALEAAGDEE